MQTITLPTVMDRTTAGAIVHQLDAAITHKADLIIEGRDVARIGQSGLQLLLSSTLTARARGASVTIQPSPAMIHSAELAGLATHFGWTGEQS